MTKIFDISKKFSPIELREQHYRKYFGPISEKIWHSTDIKSVHIDIYQFPPTDDRDYWTLITSGMSDMPQDVPGDFEYGDRTELLMYVYEVKGWMLNVLKGLAEMPFDNDTYLHWYHTVPNGKPMTAEPSFLTSYFFLPPYFEDTEFSNLNIKGERIDFLWMIPITEEERLFAIENGSNALEEIFEKKELNLVVDESRSSLV